MQDLTSPQELAALARLILATDLSDRIPELQVPTLLLSGDASPYVGLAQVRALSALLRRPRVRVFEGVRHGIAFSHAADCVAEFPRFASEQHAA